MFCSPKRLRFASHRVHTLAGRFHLFRTTDALHEIIQSLLELGFDLIGDGLGRVHGCSCLHSVTIMRFVRNFKSKNGSCWHIDH